MGRCWHLAEAHYKTWRAASQLSSFFFILFYLFSARLHLGASNFFRVDLDGWSDQEWERERNGGEKKVSVMLMMTMMMRRRTTFATGIKTKYIYMVYLSINKDKERANRRDWGIWRRSKKKMRRSSSSWDVTGSFIIGRWSAAAGDIESSSSSLGIAFDSVGDEE